MWSPLFEQVAKVYYPGLKSHPYHEVAKKQMKTFGGMVTFIMHNKKSAEKLVDVSLCLIATTLGKLIALLVINTNPTSKVTPSAINSSDTFLISQVIKQSAQSVFPFHILYIYLYTTYQDNAILDSLFSSSKTSH